MHVNTFADLMPLFSPLKRVMSRHQELVKHTTDPTDKENLRTALDAMRVSGRFVSSPLCVVLFSPFLSHFSPPLCVAGLGAECERGEARQRDHQADHHIPAVHRKHGEVQTRAPSTVGWVWFGWRRKLLSTSVHSPSIQTQSLALFGRPKIDGELKICSQEKRSKQDRCVHVSFMCPPERSVGFPCDGAKRFETPLDAVQLFMNRAEQ